MDAANDQPHAAALHQGIDPEAAELRHGQRKVALVGTQELFLLPLAHGRQHDLAGLLIGIAGLADRVDLAVNLDARRCTRRDEAVGSLFLDDPLQQLINQHDPLSNP